MTMPTATPSHRVHRWTRASSSEAAIGTAVIASSSPMDEVSTLSTSGATGAGRSAMSGAINACSIEAVLTSGYRSPIRGENELVHLRVMIMRFQSRLAAATLALTLAAWPRESAAQSASQLGAWLGLMLSPVGALAPVAVDPREIAHGADVLSLRSGRWRYDVEDAVHDNIGLAWSHSLGFARTQVTLTGAYGLVECPSCSTLVIGGIDLQSTLLTRTVATSSGRPDRKSVV